MKDTDYIRAAVELADGWYLRDEDHIYMSNLYPGYAGTLRDTPQWILDALAAQLRRQVNATGKYVVHIEPHMVIVCEVCPMKGSHRVVTRYVAEGGDESDNTIRAIADFNRETGALT